MSLVDIAPHRVHEGAVVPLHLAVDRRPIRSGASLVNLEQLVDSTENLALEIPPLQGPVFQKKVDFGVS